MVNFYTQNNIGYITMKRAEKKNALNDEMVEQLKIAFNTANDDKNTKIIVLQAEGDIFSAGADLAYLKKLQDNSFEENLADSSKLASLFRLIYEGPKVVIAAVQGHAIAGGCGLATVCDFCIASSHAKFGYTEVRIGFIPAIVSYFLLKKIGETKAKALLLTGDLIDAQTAVNYGLINQVVKKDLLMPTIENLANNIIKNCSKEALKLTKKLISEISTMPLKNALLLASQKNATARASKDCKKGINSFLNKEEIKW